MRASIGTPVAAYESSAAVAPAICPAEPTPAEPTPASFPSAESTTIAPSATQLPSIAPSSLSALVNHHLPAGKWGAVCLYSADFGL